MRNPHQQLQVNSSVHTKGPEQFAGLSFMRTHYPSISMDLVSPAENQGLLASTPSQANKSLQNLE